MKPRQPAKHIVAYPPVDFSRRFELVKPEEVTIYFHYTNEIGRDTCKAHCEHCYFENRPPFHVPPAKANAITAALRKQGFNVGMAPADSFSEEALEVGANGSAFGLKEIGLSAWSSGVPLFLPGWEHRLDRAWELGFRSIIISAHEAAGTLVPIRGVTRGRVIQQAISNINAWNSKRLPGRFALATTFTIRPDNCKIELLRKMVDWGLRNKIDVVRFNCFANFRKEQRLEQFEMKRDDIVRFFGLLAELCQKYADSPVQLGISEDFGDAGIEQVYEWLPPVWQTRTVGWCRAGYRLFSMVGQGDEVIVVGCVDKWEPELGRVVPDDKLGYVIKWDYDRIEAIRSAVVNQEVYACWGGVGYKRNLSDGLTSSQSAEDRIFKGKP
jgi:hypothetical protein